MALDLQPLIDAAREAEDAARAQRRAATAWGAAAEADHARARAAAGAPAGDVGNAPPSGPLRDDTALLQRRIEAVGRGGTLRLPAGVYGIDPTANPYEGTFGGLRVPSDRTLVLDPGCELRALPTSRGQSSVVAVYNARNVVITGGGRIVGERSAHRGRTGEWGFGVALWSAEDVTVSGVEVADLWGDAVYVGYEGGDPRRPCRRVTVAGCHLHDARRQGISVVGGHDVRLVDNVIEGVAGTAPQGGIDLEPDHADAPVRDVLIRGNTIADVEIGILVLVSERTTIQDNHVTGRNSGIVIGSTARGVLVERNVVRSVGNGGGAAFHVLTRQGPWGTVEAADNVFSGGGAHVVDFDQGRGVRFVRNAILAERPGQRAARSVGRVVFQDNRVVLRGAAVDPAHPFLHLEDAVAGGNRFTNETGRDAYALLRNVTERTPDVYDGARRTARAPRSAPRAGGVRTGRVGTRRALAPGAGATLTVTGFDATRYYLFVRAAGGGERGADPEAIAVGPVERTTTGFSVRVTNRDRAAQSVGVTYDAVPR